MCMYSYMHVVVLESYCHLNACQRSAKTRRPKLLYRTCSESIRVSTPHKSFIHEASRRPPRGACTLFTHERRYVQHDYRELVFSHIHMGVRSSPSKCFFHTYLTKDCWGPLGTAGDGWLGTAGDGWGRLGMLGTAGDRDL